MWLQKGKSVWFITSFQEGISEVTKSRGPFLSSQFIKALCFRMSWFWTYAQVPVHWIGEAIQPSHPLLPLLLLSSIFPSIRVFSSELAFCIRWPMYWSFSFSISPFNAYSGLISFRMNWFELPAVQETLKSRLQHHSLKALIFLVLSFLYGPTLTSVDHC